MREYEDMLSDYIILEMKFNLNDFLDCKIQKLV